MATSEGCSLELFPCISMGTGQLFCFPPFNISLMIISEILCLLETWPKVIRKRKCHRLLSRNYFSHSLMPGKAVLAVGKQTMRCAVFVLLVSETLENAICTYKYSVLFGSWQQWKPFFSKKNISHNLIYLFLFIHRWFRLISELQSILFYTYKTFCSP